MPNSSKD